MHEISDHFEIGQSLSRIVSLTEGHIAPDEVEAMALISLIHNETEQALYRFMLAETQQAGTMAGAFSVSRLMIGSGIHNHSKVRRGRSGLLEKLSIERKAANWTLGKGPVLYTVFSPEEILERRRQAGLSPFAEELAETRDERLAARKLVERFMQTTKLSPREAQVALKCSEGLTNADIGKILHIHEETVKFHLRNIFIKFGVKRRAELKALLFHQEGLGAEMPCEIG
jgi:DNA-binding CsgD family transcriptional regulator